MILLTLGVQKGAPLRAQIARAASSEDPFSSPLDPLRILSDFSAPRYPFVTHFGTHLGPIWDPSTRVCELQTHCIFPGRVSSITVHY